MPLKAALHKSSSIPALPWDALDIEGLSLVKSWSQAIGKALKADALDAAAVHLAGKACVVESQILNGITLGRSVANAAGIRYLSISPADADFVAILNAIDHPTVVHLEPGAWQDDFDKVASQWPGDMPESVQEKLSEIRAVQGLLMEALQSRPLVFLTLTNEMATFSGPLQQVGGFDRQISLRSPVQEMTGAMLIAQLGDCASPSLQSASVKIAGLMSGTALSQDAVMLRLKRLAAEENRAIELADLIDVILRGTTEATAHSADTEEARQTMQRVAWHEAGHALMTVIDSKGQRIPDYASACGSPGFGGVVYSVREHNQNMTYASLRHDVRVALAGRAAEEVAYGSENVSVGAASDLSVATKKCTWAFSAGGLAPGMDDAAQSGTNLALVLGDDAAAMSEVRALVQRFLADEYAHVLNVLLHNKRLLDALAQRLVVDRIVDQTEMREIFGAADGRLS